MDGYMCFIYFSFRTQVADMRTRLEPSSLESTLIQRYNSWTALKKWPNSLVDVDMCRSEQLYQSSPEAEKFQKRFQVKKNS